MDSGKPFTLMRQESSVPYHSPHLTTALCAGIFAWLQMDERCFIPPIQTRVVASKMLRNDLVDICNKRTKLAVSQCLIFECERAALMLAKCIRCRRLKKKCTGDSGDGRGCESCQTSRDPSDCIFVRPGTMLWEQENSSGCHGSMSTRLSSPQNVSVFKDCAQSFSSSQDPLYTAQYWQRLPPTRTPPLSRESTLPTPAPSPAASPGMTLLNSPWAAQPIEVRLSPPRALSSTHPAWYASQTRKQTTNDGGFVNAGYYTLAPYQQRSELTTHAAHGRRGKPTTGGVGMRRSNR